MDQVHIDCFEYNKHNFLIMADSYSQRLHVEIVGHCNTKKKTLCLKKGFCRYDVLVQSISDNGTQFTSS